MMAPAHGHVTALLLLCLSLVHAVPTAGKAGSSLPSEPTSAETKSSSSSRAAPSASTNDLLLQWVLDLGGYWNPKQSLGFDEHGLFGVFAQQEIQEDEILAQIPWTAVIVPHTNEPHNSSAPNSNTGSSNPKRFDNCDTVQLLKQEFEKGNSSHYKHYTQALQQAAQVHKTLLPAYWTPAGKQLLQTVLSNNNTSQNTSSHDNVQTLPPKDMFLQDFEWKQKCETIHQDATLLVMTHGEDFGMVPITDRYNSRGGEYTGAYFSKEGGHPPSQYPQQGEEEEEDEGIKHVALEMRAWRDLQPGEQIFTDYHDYGQIGTPELLRDYGFVEFYPQKYIFHQQEIAFDIEQDMEITWLKENNHVKYFRPDKHNHNNPRNRQRYHDAIDFLREEHQRLQQQVCPAVHNTTHNNADPQQGPTQHEVDTTSRFCHSIMVAMEAALIDLGIIDDMEDEEEERNLQQEEQEDCEDGPCSEEL